MTQTPLTEFNDLSSSLSGVPGIPIVYDATSAADPFVRYLIEMLATEGWNHTYILRAQELDPALLESAPVVMTYGSMSRPEVYNVLLAYVRRGGGIVALRPDAAFASHMGVDVLSQTAFHGYWKPHRPLAPSMVGPFQFHSQVDQWNVGSACRRLAHWGETKEQASLNVAALIKDVGLGKWAAFAFNPVESVAYMRQGSPVWANTEGDGIAGIRSDDMFFRRDGRHWNDLELDSVPQADLLQRFLMRTVERASRCPLPRVWYFPDRLRTVISILSDTHHSDAGEIGRQVEAVGRFGGELSMFMAYDAIEKTESATVEKWRKQGHDVALLPYYGSAGERNKPDPKQMLEAVKRDVEKFVARFGFRPRCSRTHDATWVGWVMQAAIERASGLELNATHSHRAWLGLPQFGGHSHGYLNGSALPQRFVDEKGRIIDCYQVQAHMTDQVLHTWYRDQNDQIKRTSIHNLPAATEETVSIVLNGLSPHAAMERIAAMIESSFEHTFGYLMYQWDSHTYAHEQRSRIWLRELFTPYLDDAGIPIWSTGRICSFIRQRRKFACDKLAWNGSRLDAALTVPSVDRGTMTIMLPADGDFGDLVDLRINGDEHMRPTTVQLQGQKMVLVNVPAGKARLQATYQPNR